MKSMHLDIPWYFIHVFIYLNITAIKSLWSQFYLNLMDRQEILTLRHPLVIFGGGGSPKLQGYSITAISVVLKNLLLLCGSKK